MGGREKDGRPPFDRQEILKDRGGHVEKQRLHDQLTYIWLIQLTDEDLTYMGLIKLIAAGLTFIE